MTAPGRVWSSEYAACSRLLHMLPKDWFRSIQPGPPQVVDGLIVVPLIGDQASVVAPLPLASRIDTAKAAVSELATPEVRFLRVENRGEESLFLLAGELLRGGRQDRLVNNSVIVPPRAEVQVPVTCVEQRRWSEGARFCADGEVSARSVRGTVLHSSIMSLMRTGERRSDQHDAWRTVDGVLRGSRTHSPSKTLLAVYEAPRAVAPAPLLGQLGVAFCAGDTILSMELFGGHALLAHYLPGLTRAMLVEKVPVASAEPEAAARRVTGLLQSLYASWPPAAISGVAVGDEWHWRTESHAASALGLNHAIVHLHARCIAAGC